MKLDAQFLREGSLTRHWPLGSRGLSTPNEWDS